MLVPLAMGAAWLILQLAHGVGAVVAEASQKQSGLPLSGRSLGSALGDLRNLAAHDRRAAAGTAAALAPLLRPNRP